MKSYCILCKKRKSTFLFNSNGYSIVKCNSCKLIYTSPLPSDKELDLYYSKFNFKDGFKFENILRGDARRSISNLNKLGYKNGDLLDIGCGAGFFMDEAKNNGWNVMGIDTAAIPINHATKKLKLHAVQKNILDFNSEEKFDVITLQQVIEHISNPYPILKKIKSQLKASGLLCVSTPNINSWLSQILKERFNYIIPPEHLIYYSPKTLSLLLSKAGFRVVKSNSYGYPMDFGSIYRKMRERTSNNEKSTSPSKGLANTVSLSINPSSKKHDFFENVICRYGHYLLNPFNKGSMIELYAVKSSNTK